MTIAFRPAELADRRFIVLNWLSSYRTAHTAGLIAMEDWHDVMWPQVEKLLDRPTSTTFVAYDPDESDRLVDLHGFIAADITPGPPLVLYVYVKDAYRRAGIARGLFEAIGVDPRRPFLYACKTPIVAELAEQRKIPCAKFDNNAARYPSKIAPRRNAR
jgi:GNAT superfamily N-acetyltransferase